MERPPQAISEAAGLLGLALAVSRLKSTPRTGWLDRGLATGDVESVADHSFGVALLAWAAAMERQQRGDALQPERVLLLALIHDLAEAWTGDRPPYNPAAIPDTAYATARREFLERRHVRDPARAQAKRQAEDDAMQDLVQSLPDAASAALEEAWEELRTGASNEAKFVKQVDRLETFLQSRHYLAIDPELPVGSFQSEVLETIDDPLLRAVRDAALTGAGREPD